MSQQSTELLPTCNLWTFSLSSVRTRSPSVYLDCKSCSCTSSFFFLCSTSCLAWFRLLTSLARSALSFSSDCLVLSKFALAYKHVKKWIKVICKKKMCYLEDSFLQDGSLFTRLNCSSCSVSSSTAWVCFCLISWTWASWVRVSSSRALFSTVTSCSRFALEGETHQWSSR